MRSLALLAALTAAAPTHAAQAVAASVEGLARASDAVVRGRVARTAARWSPDRRRIFTRADLEVSSAWRGAPARRLQVLVPGGVVDRIGQRVDGAPAFAPGEEVAVFLQRAEGGAFRVTGLAQGKFTVDGREARPDLSRMALLPSPLSAGERRAGPMAVAELERRVRSIP